MPFWCTFLLHHGAPSQVVLFPLVLNPLSYAVLQGAMSCYAIASGVMPPCAVLCNAVVVSHCADLHQVLLCQLISSFVSLAVISNRAFNLEFDNRTVNP